MLYETSMKGGTLQPGIALDEQEIHLWTINASRITAPSLITFYEQLLTPDERLRRSGYRFRKDRHRALVAQAFVRLLLSHYRPAVAPREWLFCRGDYGKPDIERPRSSLRFNLSHAGQTIVCALTEKRAIGVDLESTSSGKDIEKIAQRFFHPEESRAIDSLPAGEKRRQHFHDFWTLKESFIKAEGAGLSLPLDSFSFQILASAQPRFNDRIRQDFAPGLSGHAGKWRSYLFYPGASHRLALTVQNPETPTRFRWFAMTARGRAMPLSLAGFCRQVAGHGGLLTAEAPHCEPADGATAPG